VIHFKILGAPIISLEWMKQVNYNMFTHKSGSICMWPVFSAIIAKNGVHLKVTSSYVRCKSGNISEAVHDRGVVTTDT